MINKIKLRNVMLNFVFNFLGVFIYAVGINCFVAPHKILMGVGLALVHLGSSNTGGIRKANRNKKITFGKMLFLWYTNIG